jgi:tetratricopeptide (TPR) repeat protein
MLLVMAAVDLLLLVAVGGVVVWVFRLFRGKPSKQSKRGIEWNNAGLTHYHAGRYAEALASIDRAMATDPSIATAHYNRAVVLAALGRWEESLASIDQFLTMPDADVAPLTSQADFWVFCASLHLAREQWLQAERALNEALGRKPKDLGSIYRDRCLVRLKLGRPEEAAKDGAEAVRRAPDDAVALNNFGVACSECGRFEEAIGLLERCIEWSSDFANPHRHLAWILATCPQPGLRDGARAVSLATRALELSQWTKTDWFDVLAAAYAEMGRVDEAIDWQQRHAQACLPGSTEKSASMERIKALEESRLISV